MSKPFNPIQEGKTEGDLTKRILRGISDVVRSLDDVRGRAQDVTDLFQPSVEVHRTKLHELTYRLVLVDPQGYGKRGEETLWKKGYHDVFITARRLRKGDSWNEEESALVRGLLLSGIGYYQHLIFRLQAEYALHIDGVVDFAMTVVDHGLAKGKNSPGRQEEAAWADELAARCLVYLGDLARYMRELEPGWDLGMAERLYTQAAWLDGTQGRPYNQLGTLASGRNYSLDAVYYYMRSLGCADAFQGAAGNLAKTLEKNKSALDLEPFGPVPAPPVHRAVARFLVVVDACYWDKNVNNLPFLCSEFVEGFQKILSSPRPLVDVRHTPDWESPFPPSSDPSDRLPLEAHLKVFGILFMCWEKLRISESSQHSAVTATLLAVLDAMLQQLVKRYEKSKAASRRGRVRRRRRRRCSDGTSGSEASAEESNAEVDSNDSPEVSSSEEVEEVINGHVNGLNGKSGSPEPSWVGDELLSVVHVVCCWLRYHGDTLAGCPTSAKPILENLVTIFNGLSSYVSANAKHAWLREQKLPTYEDAHLRGVPGLQKNHAVLDWSLSGRNLSRVEQIALRAYRVLETGAHLPGITVDSSTKRYRLVEAVEASPIVEPPSEECKGKLMKNMGQLWLEAEVKDLESRVRKAPGDFSPYLVVDAEALVEHIALIKQLVGSRQFIIVIPAVVLAQLDECKRESGRARETIRWLELQFQRGNRHLRSQKAQERFSLGVIKYPKKKDKEAWNFFQMMECCNYLGKQNSLRGKAAGTVTFLTGAKERTVADTAPSSDFSPSGVASTVGVTLEHVEAFHSKWKVTSKSHG